MLLDGVPHLEKIVNDTSAAQSFIQKAMKEINKKDANDLIYVLDASRDYNPEPKLETIQAKVFALDFTDDQLDPIQLHVLKDLIKRVKNGRAVIQPGTSESYGHLTMAHPELWADQVADFLLFLRINFTENTATVAYNGPEAPIRALLPKGKWRGTITIPLTDIQNLANKVKRSIPRKSGDCARGAQSPRRRRD